MEGESSASHIPFARQSKTVSRYQPDTEADISSPCYFNTVNFWDRLSQQPRMGEYLEAAPLQTSSRVVPRTAGARTDTLSWQVVSTLPKLPSPKELCQRKKKGSKRKRLDNARALSVCYHLEELKRRQSTIDAGRAAALPGETSTESVVNSTAAGQRDALETQGHLDQQLSVGQLVAWEVGRVLILTLPQRLKKSKWGGCVAQLFHEEDNAISPLEIAVGHKDPLSPFNILGSSQLCGSDSPVSNRYDNAQLLYPEWNPAMRGQLKFPQEGPMVSYTMATQERHEEVERGCCSGQDLDGFQLQSEE